VAASKACGRTRTRALTLSLEDVRRMPKPPYRLGGVMDPIETIVP
jgi:hypothetical protein